MISKIVCAFQDNHKELLEARKNGENEDELLCMGFEQAMTFVLSLLGITYDKALKMKL